jgi:hypothetical protein
MNETSEGEERRRGEKLLGVQRDNERFLFHQRELIHQQNICQERKSGE